MNAERLSDDNAILYKHSDTSFVAALGDNRFLLQFGKIAYTLSAEELHQLTGMMKKAADALVKDDGKSPDRVLARAGICEIRLSGEGFYVVRFFNSHIAMCKKMLMALMELCIGAGDGMKRSRREKLESRIDPDIAEILDEILRGN